MACIRVLVLILMGLACHGLSFGSVVSKANGLYFLLASPTPKYDASFKSSLYVLKNITNKRLDKVRDIVDGVDVVNVDFDNRIISIKWLNSGMATGGKNIKYSLVDMNDPFSSKKLSFICPDMTLIGSHLLRMPGLGDFQSLILYNDGSSLFVGMNLATLSQEIISWDMLKYVRVSGVPGGGVNSGDWLWLYPDVNGRLNIREGEDVNSVWKIPSAIDKISTDDHVALYVNNDCFVALAPLSERVIKKDGLGSTNFLVFNKQNNSWSKVQIPGGKTSARGFGPWLVGYVAGLTQGNLSPGFENRNSKPTKTGIPVDVRFEERKIFSPGKLFLYDTELKKKYFIDTQQGDSEILLVHDGQVYYRVYDEIRRADITENGIKSGVLLVKDGIVPDIHWAFLGPLPQ